METDTMPITSLDQLDPNQQYTYADYLTWRFSERVELLWGHIRQMAAPNRRHQKLSRDIFLPLGIYFRSQTCQVYQAPFDVRLPRKDSKTNEGILTVVQPDLCVICDPAKLDDAGCIGAPDWIIEILSKGNTKKEMREKYAAYEESGVREYWIVQPEYDNILVYILADRRFITQPTLLATDEAVSPHCFPDLFINLNEVFAE